MMNKNLKNIEKLLSDKNFLQWCNVDLDTNNLSLNKEEEAKMLKDFIDIYKHSHWSSYLTEWSVELLLNKLEYKNVRKAENKKNSLNIKTPKWTIKAFNPDFESDEYIWEVKWCSWSSTWTAGEKILWTPLKYSEVPKVYWKPLKIICVWYQEWEAKYGFACWNLIEKEPATDELISILKTFEKNDIEYIWFTDLLKKLSK